MFWLIVVLVLLVLLLISGIALLIEAFRKSIWWGLGCLLIAPVSFAFAVMYREEFPRRATVFLSSWILLILLAFLIDTDDIPGLDLESADTQALVQALQELDPRLAANAGVYLMADEPKALAYAGSPDGPWVWAALGQRASAEEAQEAALKQCDVFREQYAVSQRCRLVAVNQEIVLERSRRASIAELVADLPTPTPLPAPRLDPRLLDQLERYYEAGDMKAVAYAGQPEGDWVWAFAAYAANREEARVHAWRQCEDRRARAQILGKCKIVMEGNRPQLP